MQQLISTVSTLAAVLVSPRKAARISNHLCDTVRAAAVSQLGDLHVSKDGTRQVSDEDGPGNTTLLAHQILVPSALLRKNNCCRCCRCCCCCCLYRSCHHDHPHQSLQQA